MYTCPHLTTVTNVNHGFFTRNGGVSDGIYASLNCGYGSGDDIGRVTENRRRAAEAMGGTELCTVHQTHSADCIIVEKPWDYKNAPQADALATNQPGIILGVLTADCLPILFCDPKNGVIGAAHSGWKGAVSGIIEATIDSMKKLGAEPELIIASIGPAIGKDSYEVGAEFYDRFIAARAENSHFFRPSPRPGHHFFDLPGYAKERLAASGISQINIIAQDTYFNDNDFFSYRRTCKRGEPAYGRQISVIMMTG